jgi:hypothetical protein
MIRMPTSAEVRTDLVFVASCELLRDGPMEETELIARLVDVDKCIGHYEEREISESLFDLARQGMLRQEGHQYRLNQ